MSDRYHAFTVTLEAPVKDDDAQAIMMALSQIKGVLHVQPAVMDISTTAAEHRARRDLAEKLWRVLYPERAG